MSGISGLVDSRNVLDNADEILRIFEQVHSFKNVSFIQKTFLSHHCVIANTLTGLIPNIIAQPATDPSENTFLFLEGEIFNIEELLNHLNGVRNLTVCQILLELFLNYGSDFVSLLNGEFNILICQKAEKRLIILNDHLASKPMYYMPQGTKLLFGSEKKPILALVEKTPPIDPIGLLQIFAHEHNLTGRTFIGGLRCMPPASQLEYFEGKVRLSRYSQLAFDQQDSFSKTELLIEMWADQLKQATTQRLAGKNRLIFSLSAGLDSRAVACAIPRENRPISARTRGWEKSLEVIYAGEIAHRLGFSHIYEDPMRVPLSDILPKIVWRTEGAVSFAHCLSMANHTTLKTHGDFMIGGWLGDVSSGSRVTPAMLVPRSRPQFINMLYQRYPHYSITSLREIFAEEFLHKNFPGFREAFFASFDSLEAETNIRLYEMWSLSERQARLTLSTAAVDSYLFGHIRPFLDKEYLTFTMGLSNHLRFGQALYQAMIYYLGPELRDIPNANNNLKLKRTVIGNLLNKGVELTSKSKTRLFQKIRPAYQDKKKVPAVDNIGELIRSDVNIRYTIREFVHSSSCDLSIFNKTGILNMLNKHDQGAGEYTNLLCTLATFAVALPYFVYNRPTHCPPEAEPLV